MDDVRFLGGHGSGTNPYNNNHTADSDLRKRWDGQYPSLWVTDGGGGTFADIWTPNTFAQAGFLVSNTTTPGHVYELSNEHHLRNEIKFDHVENWDINAPQTEEEAGESPEALSLEIDFSHNITFANYHAYRVTRSRAPFSAAVRIYNSIRHSLPQCPRECRERLRHLRQQRLRHLPAPRASSRTKTPSKMSRIILRCASGSSRSWIFRAIRPARAA